MHAMNNMTFRDAPQEKAIYTFQNIKKKLGRTKVVICYNKVRKIRRDSPKYMKRK
jgi:hypothetical protein